MWNRVIKLVPELELSKKPTLFWQAGSAVNARPILHLWCCGGVLTRSQSRRIHFRRHCQPGKVFTARVFEILSSPFG